MRGNIRKIMNSRIGKEEFFTKPLRKPVLYLNLNNVKNIYKPNPLTDRTGLKFPPIKEALHFLKRKETIAKNVISKMQNSILLGFGETG